MRQLLLGCILVGLVSLGLAAPRGFVLEVMAANPSGGTAQLYYDIGQWYSGIDSCRVAMPVSTILQPFRFPIPPEPVKHLRLDPAEGAARLKIGRIRLLTADGAELAAFGPEYLIPMQSIESIRPTGDGRVEIVTGANNPMLSIDFALQAQTERALGRSRLTPGVILAFAALVFALLGFASWAALRSFGGLRSPAVLAAVGVGLIVFGARLYWLLHYSRPMPYWDEWETDAIDLIIPLRGGYLDWQALFIPQGEHRILLTRLLNLSSVILSGEWDPRVGMTVGAAGFAASAALVFAASFSAPRIARTVGAVLLVIGASLPFDYRNLFWGDQTQMYALNLLAVLVLTLATGPSINPVTGFGAIAAGMLSLFTMGSGLVAPAIAGVICLARSRTERNLRSRLVALGAAFLALAAFGVLLYRKAPFQGPGYATTLAQFWPAWVSRAAWPFAPHLIAAIVVWTPALALTGLLVAQGLRTRLEWFAWAIAGWALANAVGLAHGRPGDQAPFDPKYYTSMSLAVAGSVLCALALARRWSWGWSAAPAAAALAAAAALLPIGWSAIEVAKAQFTWRSSDDNKIRPFLATGDPTELRATPFTQLPYWNGPELAALLGSPLLQPVLPAGMRAAAARRPGSTLHGQQLPSGLTAFVRYLMKASFGILAAGVALFGKFGLGRPPDEKPRSPIGADLKRSDAAL